MKKHPHLASLLYTTPWMILPATHGELGQLYRNYLAGTLAPAEEAKPEIVAIEGGAKRCGSGIWYEADHGQKTAIVHLTGIVTKSDPNLLCGPRFIALDILDELVEDLAEDSGIETVIFNFNTPGGSCIGLEESAANIRDLAAEKRTIAYANSLCASAGYYLAAACDEIYASPSCQIGSIGTYIALLDDSRAWEMEGLTLKLFRVGDLKAIGHPGKAMTPAEEEYLQAMTDEVGKEFKDWCIQRRPGIEDSSMQGQVFFAKSAPIGLIDGLYRDLARLQADVISAGDI